MNVLKEFRDFAMKGSVVNMAVGVIIGGAFGKIVSSLVADIIMPPIGLLLGGVDFRGIKLTLKQADASATAVTLNLGTFVQTVVDFTIVAFAIFMFVKLMNSLRRKEEAAPLAAAPKPSSEELLLSEIRDILKKQR